MDNPDDFIFLNEHVAEKHNRYQEGEYLVIQTHSGWRLHPLHRGFDYIEASRFCAMENLGSDYNHYSLRIIHEGKLHRVDSSGNIGELSREQDWKIHEDYYNARYVENHECEIEVCSCSYPHFWSYKSCYNSDKEAVEIWRPLTCLVEDNGREIEYCPNCSKRLTEEEEEEEEYQEKDEYSWAPETCVGCKYYSPNYHVACAVHPYGVDEDACPDYSM